MAFIHKFGQINTFIYLLQPITLAHSCSRFSASYVTILLGAPPKFNRERKDSVAKLKLETLLYASVKATKPADALNSSQ
jgi:hypothetical protein